MSYRDIFGEILADHHESPRNFGKIESPTATEKGYNPLCGDQVELTLKVDGTHLDQCYFEGEGCSICMASASIMTEMVKNHSIDEVKALIEAFRQKMQGNENVEGLPADDSEEDLVALYGIKRFPVRIKCALLPWTTLKKGLDHASERK
jgi:nitrogen fixation NifU-like protein